MEVKVSGIEVVHKAERFPITKDQSKEFLRNVRHLWLRSQYMTNIMKVRSTVFDAIHDYYRSNGYYEFQSPILTTNACEGGTTLFKVDYYGKVAYLAQSWQLYAEAMIFGLEKIYTIAPSFRAEKSRTVRHLSEYWHSEMEAAWMEFDDCIKVAEELVSHIVQTAIKKNKKELEALGTDIGKLEKVKPPFPRITYEEVLELLKEDGLNVPWGKDLRTIEEQALMKHYEKPLFVTHYPEEIKAFYMKRAENPKLVLGFDLIAPHVGEIIGGSERENNIELMKQRLKKDKVPLENYEWYFDTRRYGAVPHSGFGMGVERVVQWICNLETIQDAIGFPRTMDRIYP